MPLILTQLPEDDDEDELFLKRSYKPCPACGMPIHPDLIMCEDCLDEEEK